MLQYEKISFSELIATNKTNASKECLLCQYWYFKDVGLRFEVIREGAYGGTSFRDIYSSVNGKWYRKT